MNYRVIVAVVVAPLVLACGHDVAETVPIAVPPQPNQPGSATLVSWRTNPSERP